MGQREKRGGDFMVLRKGRMVMGGLEDRQVSGLFEMVISDDGLIERGNVFLDEKRNASVAMIFGTMMPTHGAFVIRFVDKSHPIGCILCRVSEKDKELSGIYSFLKPEADESCAEEEYPPEPSDQRSVGEGGYMCLPCINDTSPSKVGVNLMEVEFFS